MRIRLRTLGMQFLQLFMVTGMDKLAEGVPQQLKRGQADEVGHVVAHVDHVAVLAQHEAEPVQRVHHVEVKVAVAAAQLLLDLGRDAEAAVGHNIPTLQVGHSQPSE
jgi:hypothetical protein